MTFCSRHRQTILPKHLPLSLAHQYSSTTSLIRFSVWFLSSILSLSLSSANLLHLPLYYNQVALSLYDCLHLPPFQFLFKVFGLRFWFDWLWANTSLDWICRCLYVLQAATKKMVPNFYSRSNDGVCHADELFMLFKPHQVPVTMVRSDVDKRVGESFLNIMSGTS